MTLAIAALVAGIAILVWSADKFVDGSAALARHLGAPSLLIGMVIVGFGTSAPETAVSAFAALENNPGIALGNAYGSNIANIALILGLTAIINPVIVHSNVLRKELPILTAVTAFAAYQLIDGELTRLDAIELLIVFCIYMAWAVSEGLRQRAKSQADALTGEVEIELKAHAMTPGKSVFWVLAGLALLILSSRLLVWGAVEVARSLGISDLFIGLTIVAVGTSLPEMASSISATRKNEHDIALGNIIGSNLYNTLVVVGLAGVIRPMAVDPLIISRDIVVMAALTVSLFIFCYGFRGQPRISRVDGVIMLLCYIGYTAYLVTGAAR